METGPPCQLCQERQERCTFVQPSGKRKRPGIDPASILPAGSNAPGDAEMESHNVSPARPQSVDREVVLPGPLSIEHDMEYGVSHTRPALTGADPPSDSIINHTTAYLENSIDVGLPQRLSNTFRSNLSSRTSETHRAPSLYAGNFRSLEALPGVSYRTVGPSGDLDLYVLNQRSYDKNNESSVQYRGLRYRRMPLGISEDPYTPLQLAPTPTSTLNQAESYYIPPPIFMIIDKDFTAQSEPRLEKQTIEKYKAELASLISPELGRRLILLYSHFVHPHFPILSSNQLPNNLDDIGAMPSSLLAAVCANALPFMVYDDVLSVRLPDYPSAEHLFRLTWILVNEEIHAPRLSTIQTCLLLLQRHDSNRYVPNTPFRPALMSTTVALCHCLGLNRDPSQWITLPHWERQLRKRVWWATWTMEKWVALGESLPSAFRDEEFDVGPLAREDIEQSVPQALDSEDQPSHFINLVTLTNLLGEVMEAFFTVRSSSRTSTNLELSLDVARPLRAKLKQWHNALPPDVKSQISQITERGNAKGSRQLQLNASASFYFSYLTVQLTLLRALLRPVSALATLSVDASSVNDGTYVPGRELPEEKKEGAKAVIQGAMAFVKEAVEFVENLGGSEWDAFWHSCR